MNELPSNKEDLERLLEKGIEVVIGMEHRVPLLEERFKIYPGDVCRMTICGSNPMYRVRHVGVLESMRIFACSKGFRYGTGSVVLKDGYTVASFADDKPFDVIRVPHPGDCVLEFVSLFPDAAEEFRKIREETIKGH